MSFEHRVRLISASINHRQLTELKCKFKNDINSKRKYSQVKDFFDLVGILTIRGIVGPEDVTILDQICQDYFKINFSEIQDSLSYTRPTYVQGNPQSVFTTSAQPMQLSDLTNGNYASGGCMADSNLNALLPEAIDIIIAGNINEKKWRPFVRALKVDINTESIAQETSTENKIRKALTVFLQKTEQHRQWPLLEFALEAICRIDLREKCRDLRNTLS